MSNPNGHDTFALRPPSPRLGALDETDVRRQPLPPLPSVQLSPLGAMSNSSADSPSASGRRTAGALAPIKPAADDDATSEDEREADIDGVFDEESELPFAIFRPDPKTSRGRLFRRRSAFSLRERDWRTFAWLRRVRMAPAVGALLAILLIVGALALVLASRAASSAGNRILGTSVGGRIPPTQVVVVQAPQSAPATTTAASPYQIGVWTSTYAPGTSGSIQIYVRVSKNPSPVTNVSVTVALQVGASITSYGPTNTDSDGIAVFTVYYSGATPGQPIAATATATINGQRVTGQTVFVAGGGSAPDNTQNPTVAR